MTFVTLTQTEYYLRLLKYLAFAFGSLAALTALAVVVYGIVFYYPYWK